MLLNMADIRYIFRLLAKKPAFEPCGNLDSKNTEAIIQLFEKPNAMDTTICMVTHGPRSALRVQRYIELLDGQMISDEQIHKER